ncbi:polycomb group protein ASXL1 isoform X2 [Scleropages formosus]|uniref:polycomb group protein ASXL1 isoform X2 n=1 Tax=Scleropages formosus TaxID=113540 RepID=UPI0010FAB550|nr:putative Polycomb group protein ASXL1 isoform X2 [Scleropages formosus]
MKDKQKRKKERTWAEAARMVLENFSDAPMTPKQILHVIQTKGLKEMRSGTAPLACLVTMLHSQVRGDRVKNSIFFKLPGRMSLFTLKKNALQWTKGPAGAEPAEAAGAATGPGAGTGESGEQESCDSTETTAASGENDASVDETSSSASCSTEPQPRLSRSSQSSRQRKKAVMMPRVVLTPLKVNGEHVPPGLPGKRREGSGGASGSRPPLCSRSELGWRHGQRFKSMRALRSGPMKRSRGVEVDFETPGSILVNTNIRALINTRTFAAFPPHYQQQLLMLLPEVDRQVGPDGLARLSSSALNNEFFTHASQSWKERLAEGEFTHEMQARFRQEMEKEKKVEAWKEKFFEEYHGQKSGLTQEESLKLTMDDGDDVVGRDVAGETLAGATTAATVAPKRRSVGRRRRDGRMRRRSRADLRRRARRPLCKVAPATEPTEKQLSSDTSAPTPTPSSTSEASGAPTEVVLQTESGAELHDIPTSPAVATEPEPEVSTRLSPEVAEVSTVSSSSDSPSPSCSSSPSSSSERRGSFTTGSDAPAAAASPLDQGTSCISGDASASASRDSSPATSPASPVAPAKEQKRRAEEPQGHSSFPEKRPRLDDRQSFRNTVDCVHSEKPQPTTEEPKVPPIRLSRIKPPWVKGPPTYQICPRIVPPGEGSRRCGTGARTLADIKARAQQARAQREAAAAVAATGDGAGPGGAGPGGGAGVSDRGSTSRRTREHPGPVEPGGAGGGGGGRASHPEEQGVAPHTHHPGTQLQLPSVELTAPPSSQPCPETLCDAPAEGGPEVTLPEEVSVSTGELSPLGATLDTPALSGIETEAGTSPDEEAEEGDAQDSSCDPIPECRAVILSGSQSSSGALPLLAPTSIPDTLPRFGARGVDVIRTLASVQPSEGENAGDKLPEGSMAHSSVGAVSDDCQQKPESKETSPKLSNGRSEEESDEEGAPELCGPEAALPAPVDCQVGPGPPQLPSSVDEDLGRDSDSTETASDFENETNEDSSDWCLESNSKKVHVVMAGPVVALSSKADDGVGYTQNPAHNQPQLSDAPQSQPVNQAHSPSATRSQLISQAHHASPPLKQAAIAALSQPVQSPPQNRAVVPAHLQLERNQIAPVVLKAGDADSSWSRADADECRTQGKVPVPPTEDCRASLRLTSTASAPRKVVSSVRPLSSVEANNPLVTQLLQGSLPLEKVLPQPHSGSKLEISRLPATVPAAGLPQLQPHSTARLEPGRHPSGQTRNPVLRPRGAPSPPESLGPETFPELLAQSHIKTPVSRASSAMGRSCGSAPPPPAPRSLQLQEQRRDVSQHIAAVGAVPVITALSSSRRASDFNQNTAFDPAPVKEPSATEPPQDGVPERPHGQPHPSTSQPHCRAVAETPSPPHGDLCPSEVVPTVKIDWRPKPSPQLSPAPAPTVKNEAARPSCQALAKSAASVITKKEPQNCAELRDPFPGAPGGAMESLRNMEMSLVRMAKKEQGKAYARPTDSTSPSSSVPFQVSLQQQLYGKLPKLPPGGGSGGTFSYTANVSVVDGSGFSRNIADGVLQLRQRAGSGASLSIQAFAESTADEVALKCSCRLKAMIMCQGCGAFCHDDCIGPSKLCVSCLVVR